MSKIDDAPRKPRVFSPRVQALREKLARSLEESHRQVELVMADYEVPRSRLSIKAVI